MFIGCTEKLDKVDVKIEGEWVSLSVNDGEFEQVATLEDLLLSSDAVQKQTESGRKIFLKLSDENLLWKMNAEDEWKSLVYPLYSISFDPQNQTSSDIRSNLFPGTSINEPISPEKSGFVFDCWKNGDDVVEFPLRLTQNLTLTACYNPIFTYSTNGQAITITGLTTFAPSCETFTIPSTIDNIAVKEISVNALAGFNKSQHVIIEENIEKIGEYAFSNSSIRLLELPVSLIEISENAFKNSASLETIEGANSLESIYANAFDGTAWQEEQGEEGLVIFRNFIIDTGEAFSGIITMPNGLKIAKNAFVGNSAISEIEFSADLESIDANVVQGCNNLEKVKFHSALQVPQNAFDNLPKLSKIDFVGTKSQFLAKNLSFANCTEVVEIAAADQTFLSTDACFSCTYIGGAVKHYKTSYQIQNKEEIESIEIGSGIESIMDYAFSNMPNLETVKISKNLATLSGSEFVGLPKLSEIYFAGTSQEFRAKNHIIGVPQVLSISCSDQDIYDSEEFFSLTFTDSSTGLYKSTDIPNKTSIKSVVINGVTTLASQAFYGCENLTEITIPASVTSVGNNCFWGCSSLSQVIIENVSSTKTFGDYAFYGCSNLKKVVVDNLEDFKEMVFTSYVSSPLSCGADLYVGSEKITSVTYDADDTIVKFAFCGCNSLEEVTINAAITEIPENAFYACENLSQVNWHNNITKIGRSAFNGCLVLENITLPSALTEIGEYAFFDCQAITQIEIPAGVSSLGEYAFMRCFELESVVFAGSLLTEIEEYTFNSCRSLLSITLPSGITKIATGAFDFAIYIEEIVLPATLKEIGDDVFGYSPYLANIFYAGSVQDFQDITIGTGNEYFNLENVAYFVEDEANLPTDEKKYWHYSDGIPTLWESNA